MRLRRASDLFLTAALPFVALAVIGCGGPEKGDGYVARVGDAVLTRDDLVIPGDSLADPAAVARDYVNEWIVTEMLSQEAERRNVTDRPEFQRQLSETRKRLAVAALLQQEVYGGIDTAAITAEAIAGAFAASGDTYLLRDDLVQASLVLFRERDAAATFRTAVLRGMAWDEALRKVAADTTFRAQIIRTADHAYFTRATLYPEELWRLARSLPREELSFPLRSPDGYTIIRVHRSFRQGELPPLDYVSAEVRENLLMDLRRQRYDEFIRELRQQHTVDIRDPGTDAGPVQE